MKRADLDGLDREALIRLAEEQGVSRPRILTRPELVDEILLRRAASAGEAEPSIARGFFGLARDLVARVVERGLHLPDAASKIRSIHLDALKKPTPPAVLPTVTLAQIYASQGHTSRAVDTLKRVLEAEPDHGDARDLLRRLEDSSYVPPKEALPPEPDDLAAKDPADEEKADLAAQETAHVPAAVPTATLASEPESPAVDRPVPDQDEEDEEDVAPTLARRGPDLPSWELDTDDDVGPTVAMRDPSPARDPASPVVAGYGDEQDEDDAAPTVAMRNVVPTPAMLDDAPLPPKYDVDECVAIPVDPETLFVYWEVRDRLLAKVREGRGEGILALRALVVEPGWHGPRTSVRDHDVHASLGEFFLRGLPAAAVVRVAIGYRTPSAFVPIAHSPLLALPRKDPVSTVAHTLLRWTPAGTTPVSDNDAEAGFLARALRRVREQGGSTADLSAALGLPELGRITRERSSTGRHDGSSRSAP